MPKARGITPHQTRIVKAKVEATLKNIPQREFAKAIYPEQTPQSAEVSVSRELNKANVREALEKALDKHGITIEKATAPIAEGLQAMKQNNFTGEFTVDHSIRLKAASMALDVLGAKGEKEKGGDTFIFNKGDIVKQKYVKE